MFLSGYNTRSKKEREKYDEDRYIAIGKVGDVLFVVFTERRDTVRIISARLATSAERGLYYDQDINY